MTGDRFVAEVFKLALEWAWPEHPKGSWTRSRYHNRVSRYARPAEGKASTTEDRTKMP